MNELKKRQMTLRDVRALLPRLYSGESVRLYDRAFARLEVLMPQKMGNLPADERVWAAVAAGIVWAGEFKAATPTASKRAFDACVGKVATAIRRAKKLVADGQPQDTETSAAWDLVSAYVKNAEQERDANGRPVLPNMSSLSIANLRCRLGHVHPARIDLPCATAALHALPADKASSFRAALRFFDQLVREQNRHAPLAGLVPEVPVGKLPTLRDAALDWSRFNAEFMASFEAAIATAIRGKRGAPDRFHDRLGTDRLAARRAARKVRKKRVANPDVARRNYRLAVSWLVRHGFRPRGERELSP